MGFDLQILGREMMISWGLIPDFVNSVVVCSFMYWHYRMIKHTMMQDDRGYIYIYTDSSLCDNQCHNAICNQ